VEGVIAKRMVLLVKIARVLHREVKTVNIVAQTTNKVYGIMDLIFQKSVCFCLLVMEKGNTKPLTPIFNKKLWKIFFDQNYQILDPTCQKIQRKIYSK
jgi:hypothetical protein